MTPRRLLSSVWFLSWFELYLEIFRHHHVTPALLGHPMSWIWPVAGGSMPGLWLRAVLLCSLVAPIAYVAVIGWNRGRRRPVAAARNERPFSFPAAAITFGTLLVVLAVINQLIRHDPLTMDLTLRTGNGGFMCLGALLAAAGLALARRRPSRQAQAQS